MQNVSWNVLNAHFNQYISVYVDFGTDRSKHYVAWIIVVVDMYVASRLNSEWYHIWFLNSWHSEFNDIRASNIFLILHLMTCYEVWLLIRYSQHLMFWHQADFFFLNSWHWEFNDMKKDFLSES